MANRSAALQRKPASALLSRGDRARDSWGIGVRSPTAYELYFGRLRAESAQRAQLEDAFFDELWVRHGTSKTTYHHRLDDLNELVEPLLPPDRPLDILDVAASSGISTLEWLESLTRAGIAHRMVAADAVVHAYLLSFGSRLRALIDTTGFLMQLDIGGRAISARPPGCLGRLRFLPAILLIRGILPLLGLSSGGVSSGEGPRRRFGITCQPLELVTPSLLGRPGVEVVEDDILRTNALGRRFHVVRAANILNLSYFDVPTLRRILLNLKARLLPNGLLVVCRSMPGRCNAATIFRLEQHGAFSVAAELNEGSEIADVVRALDEAA